MGHFEMTDEEHYKLLEAFANNHSIAKGGGIDVKISTYSRRLQPRDGFDGMRCEDTEYLNNVIEGASQLLFYLRRNGYEIRKSKCSIKK